eukprot:4400591-Prymnesium_polylepis.3
MRQSAVDALDDSHASQFTVIVRRARARRAKSADHKAVGGEGRSEDLTKASARAASGSKLRP